eukprot:949678-Amphidinium_carterae.1
MERVRSPKGKVKKMKTIPRVFIKLLPQQLKTSTGFLETRKELIASDPGMAMVLSEEEFRTSLATGRVQHSKHTQILVTSRKYTVAKRSLGPTLESLSFHVEKEDAQGHATKVKIQFNTWVWHVASLGNDVKVHYLPCVTTTTLRLQLTLQAAGQGGKADAKEMRRFLKEHDETVASMLTDVWHTQNKQVVLERVSQNDLVSAQQKPCRLGVAVTPYQSLLESKAVHWLQDRNYDDALETFEEITADWQKEGEEEGQAMLFLSAHNKRGTYGIRMPENKIAEASQKIGKDRRPQYVLQGLPPRYTKEDIKATLELIGWTAATPERVLGRHQLIRSSEAPPSTKARVQVGPYTQGKEVEAKAKQVKAVGPSTWNSICKAQLKLGATKRSWAEQTVEEDGNDYDDSWGSIMHDSEGAEDTL